MKKKALVMVIEDESLLLDAITKKMAHMKIETVSYTEGHDAISYLKKNKRLPNIIWLDYYLKGKLNGLDILRELKSNKKWAKIPVVVVSNTASDDKVKTMLGLGIEKYLLKADHRLEEIIDIMEDLLE